MCSLTGVCLPNRFMEEPFPETFSFVNFLHHGPTIREWRQMGQSMKPKSWGERKEETSSLNLGLWGCLNAPYINFLFCHPTFSKRKKKYRWILPELQLSELLWTFQAHHRFLSSLPVYILSLCPWSPTVFSPTHPQGSRLKCYFFKETSSSPSSGRKSLSVFLGASMVPSKLVITYHYLFHVCFLTG